MTKPTILVTGATGKTGAHVVDQLVVRPLGNLDDQLARIEARTSLQLPAQGVGEPILQHCRRADVQKEQGARRAGPRAHHRRRRVGGAARRLRSGG